MKLMHVGIFLKEGYFEPSGMTLKELAELTGSTPASLSRLFSGKATLSYEMAVKLEEIWPRKAETWLAHQARYELEKIRENAIKINY